MTSKYRKLRLAEANTGHGSVKGVGYGRGRWQANRTAVFLVIIFNNIRQYMSYKIARCWVRLPTLAKIARAEFLPVPAPVCYEVVSYPRWRKLGLDTG